MCGSQGHCDLEHALRFLPFDFFLGGGAALDITEKFFSVLSSGRWGGYSTGSNPGSYPTTVLSALVKKIFSFLISGMFLPGSLMAVDRNGVVKSGFSEED